MGIGYNMYNNSICIIVIYNITPQSTPAQKLEHTIKHITPQPSTPIERAGSDIWKKRKNINKYM